MLFKVCHVSLQIHKANYMCYFIYPVLYVSTEKEHDGIRALTFLKVFFGDKLHGVYVARGAPNL